MSKISFLILFFIFIFSTISNVYAQKNDTVFYSLNNDITIKEKAMFYVLRDSVKIENGEKKWLEKKFDMNNELIQICPLIEIKENSKTKIVQDGICRKYYISGKFKGFDSKNRGVPDGQFEEYYEDGKLMKIGQHKGWEKEYIYHFYDENGRDVLKNGSGIFKRYSEYLNTNVFYHIEDSIFKFSYSIDQEFKDTVYLEIDSEPDFGESANKLQQKLAKVKIPLKTIKEYSGIGLRYRVVIMEDGKIDRIRPIGSIDTFMDQKFITCIRKYGDFKPQSLKNGQKVKMYFSIPIRLIFLM
jgi:antitoxin component YwqK of YwqJK toxin-antitoxin module